MTDDRPSDAEPESAVLADGSLASTSTADGAGTAEPGDQPVPATLRPREEPDDEPDGEPSDRLVQGNRVTTKEDME